MPLIESESLCAVYKNMLADLAAVQDGEKVGGFHVPDAAVGRSDDAAAFDHIVQSNVISRQKGLFLFEGTGDTLSAKMRQKRPEAVLRMTVKKLALPGFYGREAAQNQYAGIRQEKGPKPCSSITR